MSSLFLLEVVEETMEIADKTGATTNISHLKASRKANWGKAAEAYVVVFDPKTYRPKGNFTHTQRYAEGVEYLLVNGQMVIDKGSHHFFSATK